MKQIIDHIKELQNEYHAGTPAHTVLRKLEVELPGLFPQFGKFTLLKETPTIATDNTIPLSGEPEDKGQTAEDILKKHFDEDWPEDMGVRGTAEEWEAFKENQPVFIKSMIEAMTEYASLKEQEARRQAIQECIQILGDSETKEITLRELEKLKK